VSFLKKLSSVSDENFKALNEAPLGGSIGRTPRNRRLAHLYDGLAVTIDAVTISGSGWLAATLKNPPKKAATISFSQL
jgi:hypothetical protein